jgi:hypothetical protein
VDGLITSIARNIPEMIREIKLAQAAGRSMRDT